MEDIPWWAWLLIVGVVWSAVAIATYAVMGANHDADGAPRAPRDRTTHDER